MAGVVPEANRVPAPPVVEALNEYLNGDGEEGIPRLAERLAVKADTLLKLTQGHGKTVDFDFAERILIEIGSSPHALGEAYEQAILQDGATRRAPARTDGMRFCARHGCAVMFAPQKYSRRKRFCSQRCQAAAWSQKKKPPKTTLRGPGRALEKLVCRNGHERTQENTVFNGKAYFCKVCKHETDTACRRRKGVKERKFRNRTQVPA